MTLPSPPLSPKESIASDWGRGSFSDFGKPVEEAVVAVLKTPGGTSCLRLSLHLQALKVGRKCSFLRIYQSNRCYHFSDSS